ncbi:DUF4231 domain-containing protein [Phormidesmis priestleyi]
MSEGDREIPLAVGTSTAPGTARQKQKDDYNKKLEQEFTRLIDLVELPPLQKEFMRSRWLDQILWMENRAATARNWHRRLRLITIIGGVIIPAFVSLSSFNLDALQQVTQPTQTPVNTQVNTTNNYRFFFGLGAFVLSQVVAISAASEQFFNNGDRWRHYRRSVESLKTQGWQFFQLTGPYATYSKAGSHKDAFTLFAGQVEEILQRDVEVYSTQVVQEKKKEEDKDKSQSDESPD